MVIEGYSNNDVIQDNIIIVRIKQLFRIVIVSHMIIVLHKNHIKRNQKFWEFREMEEDGKMNQDTGTENLRNGKMQKS